MAKKGRKLYARGCPKCWKIHSKATRKCPKCKVKTEPIWRLKDG